MTDTASQTGSAASVGMMQIRKGLLDGVRTAAAATDDGSFKKADFKSFMWAQICPDAPWVSIPFTLTCQEPHMTTHFHLHVHQPLAAYSITGSHT